MNKTVNGIQEIIFNTAMSILNEELEKEVVSKASLGDVDDMISNAMDDIIDSVVAEFVTSAMDNVDLNSRQEFMKESLLLIVEEFLNDIDEYEARYNISDIAIKLLKEDLLKRMVFENYDDLFRLCLSDFYTSLYKNSDSVRAFIEDAIKDTSSKDRDRFVRKTLKMNVNNFIKGLEV